MIPIRTLVSARSDRADNPDPGPPDPGRRILTARTHDDGFRPGPCQDCRRGPFGPSVVGISVMAEPEGAAPTILTREGGPTAPTLALPRLGGHLLRPSSPAQTSAAARDAGDDGEGLGGAAAPRRAGAADAGDAAGLNGDPVDHLGRDGGAEAPAGASARGHTAGVPLAAQRTPARIDRLVRHVTLHSTDHSSSWAPASARSRPGSDPCAAGSPPPGPGRSCPG
jgi:hypothetical protein